MRIVVRRRYAVLGLLALASVLYWLGTWAWIRSSTGALEAGGTHPVALAMHEAGLVFEATWTYVVGLAVLHGLVAAVTAWRRDHEALVGVGWSALFHLAFLVGQGILAPPSA